MSEINLQLEQSPLNTATSEERTAVLGSFIYDTIATVNLSGRDAITEIFYPEVWADEIQNVIANPSVPERVFEQFPEEPREKIEADFKLLVQTDVTFTGLPLGNFNPEEDEDIRKWIKFNTRKNNENKFLLEFADTFNIRTYLRDNAPDVQIDFEHLKSMYLHFALMECMSNKMMESQNKIEENRSGFSLIGE